MTSRLKPPWHTNQSINFFRITTPINAISPSESISLFARRYKVSRTMSHVAFPQFNSFMRLLLAMDTGWPEEDLKEQVVET